MKCWKAIIQEIEAALGVMPVYHFKSFDEALEHNFHMGRIDGMKTIISIPFMKINGLEAKKNK